MAVASGDVLPVHAVLLPAGGISGAVPGEITPATELRFDQIQP